MQISSGQGVDSEHGSDPGAVSNLGSNSWVPHPGGLGASATRYCCLERKRTKILNESPLVGFRAAPVIPGAMVFASGRGGEKKLLLTFLLARWA